MTIDISKTTTSRTSEKNWEDYRILVCHQKVIASIKRTNKKELTNISQGARPIKINPNKEMMKIAVKASSLVKADYAGVDIIKDNLTQWAILEEDLNNRNGTLICKRIG